MRHLASCALVSVVVAASAGAQARQSGGALAPAKWADTVAAEIESAQRSGDVARVQAARGLAERVATAYPEDGLILHYEGFALLREAEITSQTGANVSAQLQRAIDIFNRSAKLRPLAETYALISSADGQLIDANPSQAMELGMASQAAMTQAMTLGANNPRVWLTRGQGALYTPPEYGGGVATGLIQLKRAVELFASDAPKPGEPSWGRAEAYLWLGQVYEKSGDREKAAAAYKSAVDLAPDYAWARSLLAGVKR